MVDIRDIKAEILEKFPKVSEWMIKDIDKNKFVNPILFLLKHLQENEEDEEVKKIYNSCKALMEEKMEESREALNQALIDIYYPYTSKPKKLSQRSLSEINYEVGLKIKRVGSIKTKTILSYQEKKDYDGLREDCLKRDRMVVVLRIIYFFTLDDFVKEI